MHDKTGRPFTIRRYHESDRPALEAMYADFRPKRAAQGLPPDGGGRVHDWLQRVLGRGVHMVAERDSELIGHAMLIPMERDGRPDYAEFANFLHQSVRNRGIGTALARSALEEARHEGYSRVWLSVEPSNRPAVRSYRNAGFEPLSASIGLPEIEMEARLA